MIDRTIIAKSANGHRNVKHLETLLAPINLVCSDNKNTLIGGLQKSIEFIPIFGKIDQTDH